MKSLPELVNEQVAAWLREPPSPFGKVRWIEGREGRAYVRYNAGLERLDLASIELHRKQQRKGTSKKIVALLCATTVRVVRIENIFVPEWARKMAVLTFPGRTTAASPIVGEYCHDIQYVREAS